MAEDPGEGWLTLDEAARRLGVSRLRLREGIAAGAVRAQRDNRGFWRVWLGDGDAAARARLGAARTDPAELVGLLFDEIEEATAALAERDVQIDRLTALAARHESLLERALALAAGGGAREADEARLARLAGRSDALIARSIETLEKREQDLTRMSGLMDRALTAVATLDAEVVRQSDVARRQNALLERLLALAHASLDKVGKAGGGGGFLARIRSRLGGDRPADG